jgi:hypothetical protein
MLFGETVAVYCENHTEHTDTFCGLWDHVAVCVRVPPLSLLGNGSVKIPLSLLGNSSVKIPLSLLGNGLVEKLPR